MPHLGKFSFKISQNNNAKNKLFFYVKEENWKKIIVFKKCYCLKSSQLPKFLLFYFYSRCSLSTIVYDKFYDWEQHFAEEGFLVLTSRYRSSNGSEETIVKEVLKEVFKRQVDLDTILNGKLMTQEMAFIQSNQVSV